jgi:hypothetical protein
MTVPNAGLVGSAGMQRRSVVPAAVGLMLRVCIPALLAFSVLVLGTGSAAAAGVPKITKPGAPTGVVALPVDGGATISWTAPASDGGSLITSYLVTVGHGVACLPTGSTSCAVTGLTNGRGYVVHVRAVNAVGTGRAARAVRFIAGQSQDCADLEPGADLQYCRLGKADLAGVDLAGANLGGAKLAGADLSDADLLFANLTGADFTDASMEDANLTGADLESAYLINANLTGADLAASNLEFTDIAMSNFTDANLGDAANLDRAVGIDSTIWSDTTCPDETNSDSNGGTCVNHFVPQ